MERPDQIPHPKTMMTTAIPKDAIHPSKREEEINRMCDAFEVHLKEPNKIHYKTMRKFEPLFSHAMKERVEKHELSYDEEIKISELSQELISSLNNIYAPIHIVDDNGEDVMSPLPPLFNKIHTLSGEGNSAIQILFNAFTRDDVTPMGTIQQKKATVHLSRLLAMSQNTPEILEKIKQFNDLVAKHNAQADDAREAKRQKEENQKVNTSAVSEDLLNFDDD